MENCVGEIFQILYLQIFIFFSLLEKFLPYLIFTTKQTNFLSDLIKTSINYIKTNGLDLKFKFSKLNF